MEIDESNLRICLAVLDAAGSLAADDPRLRALERASAGGRIKIGASLVSMLLRDGAEVIVVTRFPVDAARRFAALPDGDRHVVNVSAVEGQFGYANKTPRHPHTNMAKAALNMLTRTCADEWARAGIYINSVDTGWITQENSAPIEQRLAAEGFCPPLDIVDGAARIHDPIVRGVEGRPIWGAFLKDYDPTNW